VKKSKGGNKKQSDINPKQQRKKKQVLIVLKVVVCVKVCIFPIMCMYLMCNFNIIADMLLHDFIY